jgi:hypothetical protein
MRHPVLFRRLLGVCLVALMGLLGAAPAVAQETNALAWARAIQQGDATWQAFETAWKNKDRAALRRLALEVRADPVAVRRLNLVGDPGMRQLVSLQHQSIQNTAKHELRLRLMEQHNVGWDDIEFFEATNAPRPGDAVKVGQDWDVTVRVRGRDIPHDQIADDVAEVYFEAANGRPAASLDEARDFSHRLGVEVTDAKHVEAYGLDQDDARRFFSGPPETRPRDPQQIREAMRYKSMAPRNEAREILDQAERAIRRQGLNPNSAEARAILDRARQAAVGKEMEQYRQFVKQYDKQIRPRVEALGGKVPDSLDEAVEIMRRGADLEIPPSEVRRRLDDLATRRGTRALSTVDDVIDAGTGLFEAGHALKPPPPAGLRGGLQTLGKVGGAVLVVLEVAGEGSRAAMTVREQAAMRGERVTWIGPSGAEMAGVMFDNMVVTPVKLVGAGLDATVGAAGRIMGEEFAQSDGFISGAAAFGRGTARIAAGTLKGTAKGLGLAAQFAGNTVLDLYEDPAGTGGRMLDATLTGLGEITGINGIIDNAVYDAEADRRAYEMIRRVADTHRQRLQQQVRELRTLEQKIRNSRSDTERRMLEKQYAETRKALGQSADAWRRYRDRALGQSHPVGLELDRDMATWLDLADRAPTMIEREVVEGVDEACKGFLETTVNRIEGLLGDVRPSELASLSRRLGTDEDHQGLMNCICRATSGGSSTVSKYYQPAPVDYSPSCNDPSNGPCVNAGFGCWRHSPTITAEVVSRCNVAYKVARALCLRGSQR